MLTTDSDWNPLPNVVILAPLVISAVVILWYAFTWKKVLQKAQPLPKILFWSWRIAVLLLMMLSYAFLVLQMFLVSQNHPWFWSAGALIITAVLGIFIELAWKPKLKFKIWSPL